SCQVQLEMAVVVPRQRRDPIAWPHPEVDQGLSEAQHAVGVLGVGVAEDLLAVLVLGDRLRGEQVVCPVQEVGDQQGGAGGRRRGHTDTSCRPAATAARTCGMTREVSSSMRADPLSTDSPGSCAQKCTSLICGRSSSSVVSSLTAVSTSHSRNAPASSRACGFGKVGTWSGGPNAPMPM